MVYIWSLETCVWPYIFLWKNGTYTLFKLFKKYSYKKMMVSDNERAVWKYVPPFKQKIYQQGCRLHDALPICYEALMASFFVTKKLEHCFHHRRQWPPNKLLLYHHRPHHIQTLFLCWYLISDVIVSILLYELSFYEKMSYFVGLWWENTLWRNRNIKQDKNTENRTRNNQGKKTGRQWEFSPCNLVDIFFA